MSRLDDINKQTLDNMRRVMAEAASQRYPEELERAIANVFTTPDGEELLLLMQQFYLARPFDVPGSPEGMGKWRDGQASVIRDILHMLERKPMEKGKK